VCEPDGTEAEGSMLRGARCIPVLALGLIVLSSNAHAEVGTVRIATGLTWPTYVVSPPGDADHLFITEMLGDIEVLDLGTGRIGASPFLTLTNLGFEGVQGLAFHPDYDSNGRFYVYYQDSSYQTQVVRYLVSDDPELADAGSAQAVIRIPQPAGNHNGGWIGFGPDGYLYVPLGDGGFQHDPGKHGQRIEGDLLGTILRIDVDGDDFPADPERNYAIPPSNPFVGVPGDDEIWAYGTRNPFRSSFDRLTGDFYFVDVGQRTWEEVNFQPASSSGGENYGWRLREGLVATPTGRVGGPLAGRTDPIYVYGHGYGPDQGVSITGGYVYRGPVVSLQGKYFFSDFANARIWSIEHDGSAVTEFSDWTEAFAPPAGQGAIEQVVSFGEDGAGNLYIVDLTGEVFQVVGSTAPAVPIPLLVGGAVLVLLVASVLGWTLRRRRL